MESSRRDGYDGYFTWGGALLQLELWGIHPKIAISGHNPPIFTRDNDLIKRQNGGSEDQKAPLLPRTLIQNNLLVAFVSEEARRDVSTYHRPQVSSH